MSKPSFSDLTRYCRPKYLKWNKRGLTYPKDMFNYRIPRNFAHSGFIRQCPWEAETLYHLAKRSSEGIVEIGRFNGGSTLLLATANTTVPIYSIDIDPQDDQLAKQLMTDNNVGSNVTLLVGDSRSNDLKSTIQAFDFIFIDGDHSYEGCTADIMNWFDRLSSGGIVAFHDCYSSETNAVYESVVDFSRHHNVSFIIPPHPFSDVFSHKAGSICAFIKN